jgi:hypothetical protein
VTWLTVPPSSFLETACLVRILSRNKNEYPNPSTDMSAARHADVLFVKNDKPEGHNDLAAYVKKEGIKHILFKEFSDALGIVQSVVKGVATVDQVLEDGARQAATSII